MIKINLATRKQATALNSGGGAKLNVDFVSLLQDSIVRNFILMVVVLFGANYLVSDYQDELLQTAKAKVERLQGETVRLRKENEKLKDYESLKNALTADEQAVRTKLDVLRKLVSDRSVPPKVLITLAEAMTESTWITAFKMEETKIEIAGGAADFSQISDVIRRLTESTYFEDVTLKDSEQKSVGNTVVATFKLAAKRRN